METKFNIANHENNRVMCWCEGDKEGSIVVDHGNDRLGKFEIIWLDKIFSLFTKMK